MIKNLVQFFRDELTATGGSLASTPVYFNLIEPVDREGVIVRETGSNTRNYPDQYIEVTVQIVSRFRDSTVAEGASFLLYDLVMGAEHYVELPAPAGLTGESAVTVERIVPLQRPTHLGLQNGYYVYTFNVLLAKFAN